MLDLGGASNWTNDRSKSQKIRSRGPVGPFQSVPGALSPVGVEFGCSSEPHEFYDLGQILRVGRMRCVESGHESELLT